MVKLGRLKTVYIYFWAAYFQAFSQNLKSGCPGDMFPHKFVKALVNFSAFSPRIGCPPDTWTPFWLKAWLLFKNKANILICVAFKTSTPFIWKHGEMPKEQQCIDTKLGVITIQSISQGKKTIQRHSSVNIMHRYNSTTISLRNILR